MFIQQQTIYRYVCSQCGKREELTVNSGSIGTEIQPSFPHGWRTGGTVRALYFEGDHSVNRVVYVCGVYNGEKMGTFCSATCEEEWARAQLIP